MAPQAGNQVLSRKILLIVLVVIFLHACSTNAMLHGSSDTPFSGFSHQYGEAMATGASSVAPDLMLNFLNDDEPIYSIDSGSSDYTLFQAEQPPVFERSLFYADEDEELFRGQDISGSFFSATGNATDVSYSQAQMSTQELLMATPSRDPLSSRPSSSRLSAVPSTPNTSFFTSPSAQHSPYVGSNPSAPAMSREVSGQRNQVDAMFSSFDDIPSGGQGLLENVQYTNNNTNFEPGELITRLTFTSENMDKDSVYDYLSNSPDILRDIKVYNETPIQRNLAPPSSPKPTKSPSKRRGKQSYKYTCEDCEQVFIRPKDTLYVLYSVPPLVLI